MTSTEPTEPVAPEPTEPVIAAGAHPDVEAPSPDDIARYVETMRQAGPPPAEPDMTAATDAFMGELAELAGIEPVTVDDDEEEHGQGTEEPPR